MRLFLDMDGVLADFDAGYFNAFGVWPKKEGHGVPRGEPHGDVDWERVRDIPRFYEMLPPMEDLYVLWKNVANLRPTILTGVPDSVPEAALHKRRWVQKFLGEDIPMISCRSKDKFLFGLPGDVLVDDWEKYRDRWVGAGGKWITHTSAAETVMQLDAIFRAPFAGFTSAPTSRGFARLNFTDRYDVECSIQKSSLATEEAIWLGANKIGLKRFEPFVGFTDIPTDPEPTGITYSANNRMHLTRAQVAELLPVLQHFVDTGEVGR